MNPDFLTTGLVSEATGVVLCKNQKRSKSSLSSALFVNKVERWSGKNLETCDAISQMMEQSLVIDIYLTDRKHNRRNGISEIDKVERKIIKHTVALATRDSALKAYSF